MGQWQSNISGHLVDFCEPGNPFLLVLALLDHPRYALAERHGLHRDASPQFLVFLVRPVLVLLVCVLTSGLGVTHGGRSALSASLCGDGRLSGLQWGGSDFARDDVGWLGGIGDPVQRVLHITSFFRETKWTQIMKFASIGKTCNQYKAKTHVTFHTFRPL